MAFSNLIAAMDTALIGALDDDLLVTVHYQDGRPDTVASAITKNPAMEEDYVPGSQTGVTLLILFTQYSVVPGVLNGDTASVNGVDYDIFQVDVDLVGGVKMKMRRRTQRWDQ